MSIPNRTVSITGVFAADASTTIPSAPVSGVAYRNTAMTGTVIREGWAYKTIVDSANFNQALYEYSSVTAQVEKYGFLPWSNLTDYVQGSVCLGSNGKIYQAKQATGPSSTAYDPTSTPTVWDPVTLGVTEFLFHHVWSEYLLNRQDWLRADTFSWQPGTTYTDAYNHLVADISGISSSTETIGSYTVTYYQATDGHKICLADQETTVANIYNESGVAWYYILDTTNQRFKLPRENPNKECIIDTYPVIGNGTAMAVDGPYGPSNPSGAWRSLYVPSSSAAMLGVPPLTQINGFNLPEDPSHTTTFATTNGASRIYKGKQYLYFYVGQFSQSATEQTAGLNSELFNGKADIDMSNVPSNIGSTAKSYFAGIGMPSDTYEDMATATYIAPANGWVFFEAASGTNNGYVNIVVNDGEQSARQVQNRYANASQAAALFMPVMKGDSVTCGRQSNGTIYKNRFYYAEGEI